MHQATYDCQTKESGENDTLESPIWPSVSLNTDGAKKRFGQTGVGGLLRDFTGNWIMGFIVNPWNVFSPFG